MNKFKSSLAKIFSTNKLLFEDYALQLFKFQAKNNLIYKQYLNHLNIKVNSIDSIRKIPFLPIDFFKSHTVKSCEWEPSVVFESSGTTGQIRSKHYVEDLSYYHKVAEEIFNRFYGSLRGYHIMALLPSYLERDNSSLVEMVDYFVKETASPYSGFYLHDKKSLVKKLLEAKHKTGKVILIGVSFALLELAEEYDIDLSGVIVMETGGMKGRREELTREELHSRLRKKFNVQHIHSEYGMTELLSQAYAKEKGHFKTADWMRVLLRDMNDPFDLNPFLKSGGINVIDLANVQSCAFVETQDIGRNVGEGDFEILGRIDNSDLRGCNLLVL